MLHCWPLALVGHVGGVQPNLTLPREEEADRALAGVGGSAAARVIVDLQDATWKWYDDNIDLLLRDNTEVFTSFISKFGFNSSDFFYWFPKIQAESFLVQQENEIAKASFLVKRE